MAEDITTKNEIDISQLSTIEEQKEYCNQMITMLLSEENLLKNRFISIQTVYEIMDGDDQLKLDLGEYLGYQYGSINEAMKLLDTAMIQLRRILTNEIDNLDLGARSMYISLWYNLAISSVKSMNELTNEIQKIESEMIGRMIANKSEETVYIKDRFH